MIIVDETYFSAFVFVTIFEMMSNTCWLKSTIFHVVLSELDMLKRNSFNKLLSIQSFTVVFLKWQW